MKRLGKIIQVVLVALCLGTVAIAQDAKEIPVNAPQEMAEEIVEITKSSESGGKVSDSEDVSREKDYEHTKQAKDKFEFEQFDNDTPELKSGDGPTAGGKPLVNMWKLSFSSLLVLLLLVGFLYILKKLTAKYAGIKNDDVIRVVSRVQVDTKNSLMMVRVYEDELLVSVGHNGIQLLSRFNQIENEDDLIAEEKANAEKEAKDKAVFEKVFEKGVDVEEVK